MGVTIMGGGIGKLLVAAIGCVLLLGAALKPAAASTLTYDIAFAATGFQPVLTTTAFSPTDLVFGGFKVTFDPSKTYNQSTSGISLTFLDGTPITTTPIPLSFSYFTATDQLSLGNSGWYLGGDQVDLTINHFSTSPTFSSLLIATHLNASDAFQSFNGYVHVAQISATPIPAALPLFVSALGGLGFLGWRRRKAA
jgi:hypothetical protein